MNAPKNLPSVEVRRLTPVMVVPRVEPSLAFWESLGFERTIALPEGSALGFAALEKEGVEIMLQTPSTARNDLPQVERRGTDAALYLEVADLAAVEAALAKAERVVRRRAPYGAEELFVREPGGHLIGFAQRA